MRPVIVRTSRLVFRYPDGRSALNGVDVDIHQGEVVAIVGKNGSGKTTLAKHFNGLLRATEGVVEIAGVRVDKQSTVDLSRTIGYCYQNPDHQIFAPTVRDEIRFGPIHLGLDEGEVQARTDRILAMVGLLDQQLEYPFNLGRGQRQLLAVASVLALEPEVLIVDEPTTGLDWQGSEAMMALIHLLHDQGTTVIAITHDMNLVAKHAERMIVMAQGHLVADGEPRQVFAQTQILDRAHLRAPQAYRMTSRLPALFRVPSLSAQEASASLDATYGLREGKEV